MQCMEHWKTISKNKHCFHFYWLHTTVWKGKQQQKKMMVLDLPFIYPIDKNARTRSSTKVKMLSYGKYSCCSIRKRKQDATLQKIVFRRKLYHHQLIATFFLKKGVVWKFLLQRALNAVTIQNQNFNTLKVVSLSAYSFCNSIYCNSTSPDLCCSRDILKEEVNETVRCTLGLIIFYLKLHKNLSIVCIIFLFHNIPCSY